jgi:hypothetical protein
MAAVLKTARGRELPRGFESHTLRSHQRKLCLELRAPACIAGRRWLPRVRTCAAGGGYRRLAVSNTCRSLRQRRAVDGHRRAPRSGDFSRVSSADLRLRDAASLVRCGVWLGRAGQRCTWRRHAAARPRCALPARRPGSGYSGVEPGRHGGVAQVIEPAHERAACGSRAERLIPWPCGIHRGRTIRRRCRPAGRRTPVGPGRRRSVPGGRAVASRARDGWGPGVSRHRPCVSAPGAPPPR